MYPDTRRTQLNFFVRQTWVSLQQSISTVLPVLATFRVESATNKFRS